MLIKGSNNAEFELSVKNYEFASNDLKEDDLDWLNIYCRIKSSKSSWEFTHPILTTWEVEQLAEWMKSIAENEVNNQVIQFIEPCLQLSLVENLDSSVVVKVCFDLEARPSWVTQDMGKFCIDFEIHKNDLYLAADSLLQELSHFPNRENERILGELTNVRSCKS